MLDRPMRAPREGGAQALSGHLAGLDGEGRPLFCPDGVSGAPTPVAIGVDAPDAAIALAADRRQRALVLVTGGPEPRWTLVALVREAVSPAAREGRPPQVVVDGETVRVEAGQRLELRCGEARILLTEDGKIVIHGTHVVSRAVGQNMIRGGSVQIN
jgi:hypothetical protein